MPAVSDTAQTERLDTNVESAGGPLAPALAEQTGYLLRVAYVRAERCWVAELPDGLSPRVHQVLATLQAHGPRSQQKLSDRLHINRTIMVSLIDEIERAGLLERRRDPKDRRSYALALTTRGRRALERMEAAASRADATLTAALSVRERRQLKARLSAVANAHDAEAERQGGLQERTVYLLDAAHTRVRESFEQRLRPLGLTPALYGPLRTLQACGPTSQRAIADALGFSGAAIQQTVDRLEADGLLERKRNPTDRRSYALELTPAGRAAIRGAETAQRELSDDLLGDEQQQDELTRLLLAVLQAPLPPPGDPNASGAHHG